MNKQTLRTIAMISVTLGVIFSIPIYQKGQYNLLRITSILIMAGLIIFAISLGEKK